MKPDTPEEYARLERIKLWEDLARWCEEIKRDLLPRTARLQPGWYDPKTMTRAVARDLGLI